MKPYLAQLRSELLLSLRNGEQLLVMLGIPLGVLVFFSIVDVLPTPTDDPVDFLVPSILVLSVMATAMTSTAIATAFERQYGVMKRLGATPLGRPRLIGAKLSSIAIVEVVQFVIVLAVGAALGFSFNGASVGLGLIALFLGTCAFGGLGLLIAGTLRAEATLAVANALFMMMLLAGGIVVALDELPGPVATIARGLPSGSLAAIAQHTLGSGSDPGTGPWLVLVGWAVAMPALAARYFSWD